MGDTLAFLRAKRKMTFRVHALRLMDHKRHEFLHEMDEQDRIFQERRGKDAHNPMKINPHRVQMFSINEIWNTVSRRLIELNVMKDPDVEDYHSDSDSDEWEQRWNFVHEGRKRQGKFFVGKKKKDDNVPCLKDLMKKNDILLINRVLEKTIDHDLALHKQLKISETQDAKIVELNKELSKFRNDYRENKASVKERFEEIIGDLVRFEKETTMVVK